MIFVTGRKIAAWRADIQGVANLASGKNFIVGLGALKDEPGMASTDAKIA
ncbi:hypothetical protein [Asticcacaulis sp. MM231]